MVDLDGQPKLALPTPCAHCGAELRGSPVEGRCPRCHARVTDTTERHLLRRSPEGYRHRVHRGLGLILAGQMIILIAFTGVMLSRAADAVDELSGLWRASILIGSISTLLGRWWFTTNDPCVPSYSRGESARRLVRRLTIASVLLVPVMPIAFAAMALLGHVGAGIAAVVILAVLSAAMGMVAAVAELVYARWLALRAGRSSLFRAFTRLLWLFPVLAVGVPAAALACGYPVLSLLGLVGPLVGALLYLNTLNSLRRAVVRVAEWPFGEVHDGGVDAATPATLGHSPQ